MTTLTTSLTTGVKSAPNLPHLPFSGRGLHIGLTHQEPGLPPARWSNHAWDNLCAQAKAWGMDVIHPKVGEVVPWYNDTAFDQMIIIAHNHGIQVVPYIWCRGGNDYNADVLLTAHIGKKFGCVILDMEDPWFHQPIAMNNFGPQVRRAGYNGPLVPTTYANCTDKWMFPYLQMNVWAAAWMPQAYWDVWTFPSGHPQAYHPMSASYALNDFLYPQWISLDKSCLQSQHKHLAPILPIISFENHPAQGEVTNWLKASQPYGYCGFWYEGAYAPYAQTVLHAPHPGLVRPVPTPPAPKPPVPVVHPPVPVPPAPKPPVPVTLLPHPVVQPGPVPAPVPVPVVTTDTLGSVLVPILTAPPSQETPVTPVTPPVTPVPVTPEPVAQEPFPDTDDAPTMRVPIVVPPVSPAPAPSPEPVSPGTQVLDAPPPPAPPVVPNPVTPLPPTIPADQTAGEIEQGSDTGEIEATSAMEALAQMIGRGISESDSGSQPAITSFTPTLPAQPDAWLNDAELKGEKKVNHVVIFSLDEVVSVFFDGKVFKLYLHLAEQQ